LLLGVLTARSQRVPHAGTDWRFEGNWPQASNLRGSPGRAGCAAPWLRNFTGARLEALVGPKNKTALEGLERNNITKGPAFRKSSLGRTEIGGTSGQNLHSHVDGRPHLRSGREVYLFFVGAPPGETLFIAFSAGAARGSFASRATRRILETKSVTQDSLFYPHPLVSNPRHEPFRHGGIFGQTARRNFSVKARAKPLQQEELSAKKRRKTPKNCEAILYKDKISSAFVRRSI